MLEGWVEHHYMIIHVRCARPFMIYTKDSPRTARLLLFPPSIKSITFAVGLQSF